MLRWDSHISNHDQDRSQVPLGSHVPSASHCPLYPLNRAKSLVGIFFSLVSLCVWYIRLSPLLLEGAKQALVSRGLRADSRWTVKQLLAFGKMHTTKPVQTWCAHWQRYNRAFTSHRPTASWVRAGLGTNRCTVWTPHMGHCETKAFLMDLWLRKNTLRQE